MPQTVYQLFRLLQDFSANSHLPLAALEAGCLGLQRIIGAERAVGLVLCLPHVRHGVENELPKHRPRSTNTLSAGTLAKARKQIRPEQQVPKPEALHFNMTGWDGDPLRESEEWWTLKHTLFLKDPILRRIASDSLNRQFLFGCRSTLALPPGEWEQAAALVPRGLGDVGDVLWTGVGVANSDLKYGFALYRLLGERRFSERELELAKVFSAMLAGQRVCLTALDKRGGEMFKDFLKRSNKRLPCLALFRDGMQPEEIAEALGCSGTHVRNTLVAARDLVQEHYPDLAQDNAALRQFLRGRSPLEFEE